MPLYVDDAHGEPLHAIVVARHHGVHRLHGGCRRLDGGAGGRPVCLAGGLDPVEEAVQVGQLDPPGRRRAGRVVGRVLRLRADLLDDDLVPAAGVRGGAVHDRLEVGQRHLTTRPVRTGGVVVLRGAGLGVERACRRDAAAGAGVAVAAVVDDPLGGGVKGGERIREACGAEPVLDQRLAVVADLVDLGLEVGGRLQVHLAVDGLAADLVSGRCQRRELGPRDEVLGAADRPAVDIERRRHAVRLQGLGIAEGVLTGSCCCRT